MFYIYKKNLNSNKSTFFTKVADKKVAESRVIELNSESLFDDEYYYISEEPPKEAN